MRSGLVSFFLFLLASEGQLGDDKLGNIVWGFQLKQKITRFVPQQSFANTLLAEWDMTQGASFKLFTRNNSRNGETVVTGNKTKLLAAGFKESLPTVMITHGFNDNGDDYMLLEIKDDILIVEDKNVIMVDWSECAKNLLYNEVIECMKEIGLETGNFLKFLQTDINYNLERVHLIGHSLGAHLMGFAAKPFPQRTIGRITGMDPAGPLFEHAPESERLNEYSAKLVDVIHTCRIFLGIRKPIGTIDFYPNGGYNQPGCDKINLRCNHAKSITYFSKTVLRTRYLAKKCDSLEDAISEKCNGEEAVMGYNIQYRTPGIYYTRIK